MRIHQTTPVYFYTKSTSTQPVHKNYTPQCVEIKDISNIYYPINFGYKHKLKNMWKDGLLKSVKYGLYGETLTKNNVSLEHIICHSNGGPTQD